MSAFLNWLTTEFLSALLLWIIPVLLIEQSRVCFGVWWWRLFTLLSTLQTLLWRNSCRHCGASLPGGK